ncbi:MAG: hypothetical protein QOH39_453 [Verrucomicrobiota bacterium]|jgi:hypothetical protein
MTPFEGYNVDQLTRVLTFSKWMLGICGAILVGVAIFNQWLAARILHLQEEQRAGAEQQLSSSQTEVARANSKAAELNAELARFTAPRRLTDEQIASLRESLPKGPHGKVVMASLKVESDAESYAAQIAKVLGDAGFDVTTTKTVWLQLAVKGIYLCARDASYAPTHAVHLQRCFQSAGLRLRAHQDKKMYSDMGVPDDAIIFVVSGRE